VHKYGVGPIFSPNSSEPVHSYRYRNRAYCSEEIWLIGRERTAEHGSEKANEHADDEALSTASALAMAMFEQKGLTELIDSKFSKDRRMKLTPGNAIKAMIGTILSAEGRRPLLASRTSICEQLQRQAVRIGCGCERVERKGVLREPVDGYEEYIYLYMMVLKHLEMAHNRMLGLDGGSTHGQRNPPRT